MSVAEPPHIEQRRLALNLANAVRTKRAITLTEMTALRRSESLCKAAELIENPPPELDSLLVERFLVRVRGMGPSRVMLMVRCASVGSMITLGHLTPRQREVLSMSLRRYAATLDS